MSEQSQQAFFYHGITDKIIIKNKGNTINLCFGPLDSSLLLLKNIQHLTKFLLSPQCPHPPRQGPTPNARSSQKTCQRAGYWSGGPGKGPPGAVNHAAREQVTDVMASSQFI